MNASTLVQKRCNYCNVLRDDGVSYGDYDELVQLHSAANRFDRKPT